MKSTSNANSRFKSRTSLVLLGAAIAVGAIYGLVAGRSTLTAAAFTRVMQDQSRRPPPHPSKHPIPAIDGAARPDLIPDNVAYRIVLGLLGPPGRPTDLFDRRAFARRVFASDGCALGRDERVDLWASTLLQHVQIYSTRRSILRERADPAAPAEHDLLVRDVTAALQIALGSEASAILDCYVTRVVKTRVNYFESPESPAAARVNAAVK